MRDNETERQKQREQKETERNKEKEKEKEREKEKQRQRWRLKQIQRMSKRDTERKCKIDKYIEWWIKRKKEKEERQSER